LIGVTVLSPEFATKARLRFEVIATLAGSWPTVISANFRIFFFVVVNALTESLSGFTLSKTARRCYAQWDWTESGAPPGLPTRMR
jgi:hypothetical protein